MKKPEKKGDKKETGVTKTLILAKKRRQLSDLSVGKPDFSPKIHTFAHDMVTLGMMQFTAVVLMLLMMLKLLLLRGRHTASQEAKRSRLLMAAGMLILAVHFALQLKLGLRQMGITQSVMLNLTMLIPASFILAWAVLLLQRRGQLSPADRWTGPLTWMVVMGMMGVATATDGQPVICDSPQLRKAELAGAVLYMLMQGYYTWQHTRSLMTMRHALQDYYDRDTDDMLSWMQLSIVGLMLLALMVPVAIFGSGPWLLVIAFAVYFFIFYLVDSFCSYLNSNAPARIRRAEENAEEFYQESEAEIQTGNTAGTPSVEPEDNGPHLDAEAMREIDNAVAAWTARGGHLKSGMLLPLAAAGIGIPKYRLTCWLHQRGMKYTDWIAGLRVEEAKRTIEAHPEWSNEAVAQHCGFTDRTLLRAFRKVTGMTPAQYAESRNRR